LPMIGKIYVVGLTVEGVKKLVQQHVNEYMNYVTVDVKLVSFKITVLGEVNKPGTYSFFKKYVTIFDALGAASDMTDFGNRQKVKIIRTIDNKTIILQFDLTDRRILQNENFVLYPYDIVYVEPLKSKVLGLRNISVVTSTLLSSIATFLLILNYIR